MPLHKFCQAGILLFQDDVFYVSSLSSRVISYKGLIISDNIKDFYIDLKNKDMRSSLCVFHQRFSTNTLPQWKLAQPFRYLAHNGEINTIQGNRHWYFARRKKLNIDSLPELNNLHPTFPAFSAKEQYISVSLFIIYFL